MPNNPHASASIPFCETLKTHNLELTRLTPKILQINVGKLCNQACLHCHVDAGPKRKEIMNREVAEQTLKLLASTDSIETVDITGGAPELCPQFRGLVSESKRLGKQVIDRCNLTVLHEYGQADLADFLANNQVAIIASLPCYSSQNVDKQRGQGVFEKSIQALRLLNELGYATNPDLTIDLVYNPLGASLPPKQSELQADYKARLFEDYGIKFNNLYTITNMPINRFLIDLKRSAKLDDYMQLLLSNFNPHAAAGVMCRDLVSLSWDGYIYDCDFNQMLDLPVSGNKISIWDIASFADLSKFPIMFEDHCYGCCAGAGSSCAGSLSEE